jgi:hypothetical protein
VIYTQKGKDLDISTVYHDALQAGNTVSHKVKQDKQRLAAVVEHARRLLKCSRDSRVQDIGRRINAARPTVSTAQYKEWAVAHKVACEDLKKLVVGLFQPVGSAVVYKSTVASIGTRLTDVKEKDWPMC